MEEILMAAFASLLLTGIVRLLPKSVSKSLYGFKKSIRLDSNNSNIIIYQEDGEDIGFFDTEGKNELKELVIEYLENDLTPVKLSDGNIYKTGSGKILPEYGLML
jgi:hypothetical protein